MKQGNSVARDLPPPGSEANTIPHTWQYVGDTLAIRQSYDSHSHANNTLLNRQVYAKMYNTLCRYVSDTSDIRYKYVTHALSLR